MPVARDRQPADDPSLRLGYEDSDMTRAGRSPEIPALLRDRSPLPVGDQPGLRLRADGLGEVDQGIRVTRTRDTDRDGHATTTPAPPRLGSPAASSSPSAPRATAETPPK